MKQANEAHNEQSETEPGRNSSTKDRCPNCKNLSMSRFYEVSQVPVHSVVLLRSVEQARDQIREEIALGHCSVCGFISNVLHDASRQEYGPG